MMPAAKLRHRSGQSPYSPNAAYIRLPSTRQGPTRSPSPASTWSSPPMRRQVTKEAPIVAHLRPSQDSGGFSEQMSHGVRGDIGGRRLCGASNEKGPGHGDLTPSLFGSPSSKLIEPCATRRNLRGTAAVGRSRCLRASGHSSYDNERRHRTQMRSIEPWL